MQDSYGINYVGIYPKSTASPEVDLNYTNATAGILSHNYPFGFRLSFPGRGTPQLPTTKTKRSAGEEYHIVLRL